MASLRVPLSGISANIQRRRELSPYERGIIVGVSKTTDSATVIAQLTKVPRTTIQSTLLIDSEHDEGTTKPRSGRPKIYDERDERLILRYVRKNPKDTYADILEAISIDISKSTIRRILQDYGLTA